MILLAAAVLVLCAMLGAAYWGTSVIFNPPEKGQVVIFPESYGLNYEKVSFKTKDGLTLRGWFIPSHNNDKRTIIMCHGWGDNKGHLLERTFFLNKTAGFNLLYFDNRAHGDSDGTITTIGPLELMDAEAALEFLKERHPQNTQRLGIFGLSMGAAVAAVTAANRPEIKAVGLESPFTSYRAVVGQWAWNRLLVPYFPMVMLTLWILRLRVGSREVDEFNPIQHAGKIFPRPLFLVSGTADMLMPETEVRRFFASAKDPKELWIVPGAEHGNCYQAAGAEYEERLIAFYRKNL